MKTYHKIQTVYKRDPKRNYKTLLEGAYSLPEFEYLKNNQWVFTEKVDGTNVRLLCRGGEFECRGKTDRAQLHPGLLSHLGNLGRLIIERATELFPSGVCLYGEGYGAKIQRGGGNYSSTAQFVLFDVKVGDWWLRRADVEEVAAALGLDVVPIVPFVGQGTLEEMVDLVRGGFRSSWGDFVAEGIVARPVAELQSRDGKRIITKVKYKDFIDRQGQEWSEALPSSWGAGLTCGL